MSYGKVEVRSLSRSRSPSTARRAATSATLTVILSRSDRAPISRTVNAWPASKTETARIDEDGATSRCGFREWSRSRLRKEIRAYSWLTGNREVTEKRTCQFLVCRQLVLCLEVFCRRLPTHGRAVLSKRVRRTCSFARFAQSRFLSQYRRRGHHRCTFRQYSS